MKLAPVAAVAAAVVLAVVATVLVAERVVDLGTAATTAPSTSESARPAQPADPGAPLRVTIPAIGVDADLVPVGLKPDGAMQTPDFGHAAWYQPGPRPGDAGPAVLVAHVDSKASGPDVFYRLRDLALGDQVTVHYRTLDRTFAVTEKEQTPKTALPADRIWNATTAPVLRLITCGGAFDRTARSYLDNIIVYADRLV